MQYTMQMHSAAFHFDRSKTDSSERSLAILALQLLSAATRITRSKRSLSSTKGINQLEIIVLGHVIERPGITGAEIADIEGGRSKVRISQAVRHLAQRGWLEKRPLEHPYIAFHPTQESEQALRDLLATDLSQIQRAATIMTPADRKALKPALVSLNAILSIDSDIKSELKAWAKDSTHPTLAIYKTAARIQACCRERSNTKSIEAAVLDTVRTYEGICADELSAIEPMACNQSRITSQLQRDGLIENAVSADHPNRIGFRLTQDGHALLRLEGLTYTRPLMDLLGTCAAKHRRAVIEGMDALRRISYSCLPRSKYVWGDLNNLQYYDLPNTTLAPT